MLSLLIFNELYSQPPVEIDEQRSIPLMKKLFNAETFTLDNGLQVIVVKNEVSPAVSIGVLYFVGTADDPPDTVGLSHFLEHMMFKGTKKVPGDKFNEEVSRVGGRANAYTTFDLTFYETEVPLASLEEIIEKEADRMVNLTYKEKDVESERKVVEEEYGYRIGNDSHGPITELFYNAKYLYHPYGVLPIGYPHHIKNYNKDNAYAWYKKWYKPNNAVLVVSGNVTVESVKKLAEKYFGPIPRGKDVERKRPQDPSVSGTTQYIVQKHKRHAMVNVGLHYKAPVKRTDNNKVYTYKLLSYLFGGNQISIFYDHFVRKVDRGIVSVSIEYSDTLDPYGLEVWFDIRPEALSTRNTLQDVLFNEYQAYLRELLEYYMNQDEFSQRFENAKRQLIGKLIHATDGTYNAMGVWSDLAMGYSVDDIDSIAHKINLVTLDEMKSVVQELFSANPSVVFVTYPDDGDSNKYKFDAN